MYLFGEYICIEFIGLYNLFLGGTAVLPFLFARLAKGREKEDDREVNFLNKTQRAIHVYGVPLPDFSNSNEL